MAERPELALEDWRELGKQASALGRQGNWAGALPLF